MGIDFRALAICILLAAPLYFTYGHFSLPWMAALPIVLALAFFGLPAPPEYARNVRGVSLVVILTFLIIAATSLLPESEWMRSVIVDVAHVEYLPWMQGLFACAGVSVIALYVSAKTRWGLVVFGVFLAFMIGAYALIMPAAPNPQIDVWTVHEEGAQAFVDGKNPYTIEYTNIYPEALRPTLTPGGVTYSYLPAVFLWMAPWKAIGLDTRYSQLLTRLLTSILLLLIVLRVRGGGGRTTEAKRDFLNYVPALLFITFPMTTFFIVRAWNDDISMMCYALAGYAMVSRRPWLLYVATNFLLLTKQHAIFFVPVLIWFAWRAWRDRWAPVKASWVAVLVVGSYLVADWRNFLGSLYGLTFLKFPNIHTVFLERRDPYSLMNYLHLYTGLHSNSFFAVVVIALGFLVLRRNWRNPDAGSVLRGLGAMTLALFIFAPIAFANYYQFAMGMILIGYAATRAGVRDVVAPEHQTGLVKRDVTSWEPTTDIWALLYIASRAVILFLFGNLILETRIFENFASLIVGGKMPYADFGFQYLPFSLIPTLLPWGLRKLGDVPDFIAYQTLFQLTMLAFDIIIATIVLPRYRAGRTSHFALVLFIFGPLLIGPLYFTSAALSTLAFVWIGIALWERRHRFGKNAALIALGVSLLAAAFVFIGEFAGFDFELDPLTSPTHVLIWIFALLPLIPPLRLTSFRRFTFPSFGVLLTGAAIISMILFTQVEAVHVNPESFIWLLWARNIFVVLALNFLGLSLLGKQT